MGQLQDETFIANADMDTHRYTLMVNSAGQLVNRQFTAGGKICGVLQNKPKSGEAATVRRHGRSRVRAGATITAGGEFSVTASGTAIMVASGDFVAGDAVTGVASGGLFDAYLTLGGWKPL